MQAGARCKDRSRALAKDRPVEFGTVLCAASGATNVSHSAAVLSLTFPEDVEDVVLSTLVGVRPWWDHSWTEWSIRVH